MFKDLFGRMGCAVGAHDGPWEHTQPCTEARRCTRCGTVEERTQHALGEWAFLAPGGCAVRRGCGRCAFEEHGAAHEWQWGPGPAPCMQVQTCARCGERQPDSRIQHAWGPWRMDPEAGRPVHECAQCDLPSHTAVLDAIAHQPPLADDRLTAAVERFFAAEGPDAERATIEQDAAAFFSVSMDPFLQRAVETFSDHPTLLPALRSLWVLLRQCHQEGIQAAFSQRPLDVFTERALALVSARRWRDKQRMLLQFPLLYDARMDPWWAHLEASVPPAERQAISVHRTMFELCRAQGVLATLSDLVEPLPPPPPAPPEPLLDPALVGTWENSDMLAYGGMTMVSYTTLVFAPSGRFVRSSRIRGGATFVDMQGHWAGFTDVDTGASPGERGSWTARGRVLTLSFDDGTSEVLRDYEVYPGALRLPGLRRRIWKRVG